MLILELFGIGGSVLLNIGNDVKLSDQIWRISYT